MPAAVKWITTEIAAGRLTISVVSAMELIQGSHDRTALTRVRQLVRQIAIVPITSSVSRTAHQLMDTYFLSHSLLIPDALIAATALEHGLVLHTRNVRDFQFIPSLVVARPY
jgi:predicted nucleic acid-binding protein